MRNVFFLTSEYKINFIGSKCPMFAIERDAKWLHDFELLRTLELF